MLALTVAIFKRHGDIAVYDQIKLNVTMCLVCYYTCLIGKKKVYNMHPLKPKKKLKEQFVTYRTQVP